MTPTVSFRVRGVSVASLDGTRFGALLARAKLAGGRGAFPILYSVRGQDVDVDPEAFADELQRLAVAVAGTAEAPLVGTLRDDLLQGLAVADEG